MRYIGSKMRLLDQIEEVIDSHITQKDRTFLDLFAGTNVVARRFKKRFSVITNDVLYFSYINAKATIENNEMLSFSRLREVGIENPIEFLQEHADEAVQTQSIGYYERSYSPTGNAMYFTIDNAKRIDYIRDQIDKWKNNSLICESEYYYLLAVLLDAIPFVSNITGTYGAFLKEWDKRALNKIELRPIHVDFNDYKNYCYAEDANQLVKHVSADIAYIDTPYNSRQYAANYHLLENIARNNKPELKGKTKVFPWQQLKSAYCSKKTAFDAFNQLISDLQAHHIIVSYNTDGILTEDEIISVLQQYDMNHQVEITRIPFRKYVSKNKPDSRTVEELIFYIQKKRTKEVALSKVEKQETSWIGPIPQLVKSPMNYIGGKYKILPQLLPLFPKDIDTFVDLFSGGANVGINAVARHYVFNDMNKEVNEIFRTFQKTDIEELVDEIHELISEWGLTKTDKPAYLRFRREYNQHPTPIKLYTLSCFSYNYQFRFNSKHEYNNPFGMNRSHFSERMEVNLRQFVSRLQSIDAVFSDDFFEEFPIETISENDFVYLDPPYLITTGSYNDGSRGFHDWGVEQERKLYLLLQELDNRGVRYALSNVIEHKGSTNRLLLDFIKNHDVHVHEIEYSYMNSSHNTKRLGSKEVVITNYSL